MAEPGDSFKMSSISIIGTTEKIVMLFPHSNPDMNAFFEPVRWTTGWRHPMTYSHMIRPLNGNTRSA
jgi:hypothetical protein